MTGRPKHLYSVYQKMIARNVGFDEIYDLVGIRILVDTVRDCYAVLGSVHARWNPVPGRFKDYIAMPKFNMYQSLHTTVIGPGGKPVELQIRTWGMHRRSEYGVAAHWKYKEEVATGRSPSDLAWLRQLVDWQRETADPAEFLESLRFEVGSAEVYVFTPRGEVIALPQGATPVDFAYAIHTEVGPPHRRSQGQRAAGAARVGAGQRRDGRDPHLQGPRCRPEPGLARLRQERQGPQQDQALVLQGAPRGLGRHRQGDDRADDAQAGPAAAAAAPPPTRCRRSRWSCATRTWPALYAAIGDGHVSAQSVVVQAGQVGRRPGRRAGGPGRGHRAHQAAEPAAGDRRLWRAVEGAADVWARLSKCCTPVPGDTITGFVTRGNGVSVHRTDCVNIEHLIQSEPERMVNVHWAPRESSRFLAAIQVEALDRTGLLSDITRSISEQHVNICPRRSPPGGTRSR